MYIHTYTYIYNMYTYKYIGFALQFLGQKATKFAPLHHQLNQGTMSWRNDAQTKSAQQLIRIPSSCTQCSQARSMDSRVFNGLAAHVPCPTLNPAALYLQQRACQAERLPQGLSSVLCDLAQHSWDASSACQPEPTGPAMVS